jgi:hypothetical protein
VSNLIEIRATQTEIPYYVKAFAMALPAVMLGLQISGWIFFLPGAMQGHCDFRDLYTAGYMVHAGDRGELYDYGIEHGFQNHLVSQEKIAVPFDHLAYEALLFVPYSYLPYRSAYFLFLATNVVLLAFAMRFMVPWTRNLRSLFPWLPAALFFTYLPVAAAFMQGQDSIILLLFFCGVLVLLSRSKMFAAGLLLGLGFFKFQIVLPIAVLFLLWRRWRFGAGFVVSSAIALALSWWLVGSLQMKVYAVSLLSMSVRETAADQAKFNVNPSVMPNLRGVISGTVGNLLPQFWTQILIGGASLGMLVWIARKGIRRNLAEQFSLAVTAGAVLSYHLNVHDLSILLIPLPLILDRYLAPDRFGRSLAAASALMFSAPAVIGLSDVHPFVVGVPVLLLLAVHSHPSQKVAVVAA